MEKYNDSDSMRAADADESTAFLGARLAKEEPQRRRQTYVCITLVNLFFFMLSSLSLLCSVMSQKRSSDHAAAKLMDQFEIYSPAMHVVEYAQQKFSLASPINSSEYVGVGDAVDRAWMEIAYLPDQMVSLDNFARLQKPADSLQVTDPATGETGYRVGLEVFHQLHCLNLLRMSTYPEHYAKRGRSDISGAPQHSRAHLDHCIEILRINLMCYADVNVFTFHEAPGREGLGYLPDYESQHVCRNFDRIKEWAYEHAVPDMDV